MLIAERIGLNLGRLTTTGLLTFGLSYRIPGPKHTRHIL